MKTAMLFLAGTMFLATAFGSDRDIARYQMKTGRYTPAKQAHVPDMMSCEKHECCATHKQQAASLGDSQSEARYKMKTGRNSPAEESRIAVAKLAPPEPVASGCF